MPRINTRRMHQLRTEFFEEGRRLAEAGSSDADCWRCRQPIDYTVPANTAPDTHNLGHYYSVRDYPELQEDPSNFRHEHALCNQAAGADGASLGLGEPVPDWWGSPR